MSRNEFVDLILKCYFADRDAANEILKYFEECEKLKDNVKDAIDYIKTTQYSDVSGLHKYSILEFWFIKDVLEILESGDK